MVDLNDTVDDLKDDIEDMVEASPKSAEDLEDMPLHSILLILSAYIAIGIGISHFFLSLLQGLEVHSMFHVIINLVFGLGLFISYLRVKEKEQKRRWGIFAIIFSLVLLALGGIVGILAGIVGVFGGGLALLTSFYKTWEV